MKNLFSKSLSKKKTVILSASFIAFTASTGLIINETTKKTVALTLDGKTEVISTHAKTVNEIFNELDISLKSQDYVFPSKNTKVKDQLKVEIRKAKQIQIVNDRRPKKVWTTAQTVEELLREQKITLNKHDKVHPKLQAAVKNEMEVAVDRAFTLKLINGGKKQEVWSTSTTVADFLLQQGIKLNKLDRTKPKLDEIIEKGDIVKIIHVEKVTDVVEEPVHFAIVTKKDNSLEKGTQKTLKKGSEGIVSKKYEVILENGKEKSRKLISKKTIKVKTDQLVAVGTKPTTYVVSRGSANVSQEFYVTSTAYTANCNGCSGRTATGINLHANPNIKVVAVDPRVIPLGTKVYVDGYGYAVAADTGSSIKGNKIDVFFSSKAEAYRWGRKTVKIKILK